MVELQYLFCLFLMTKDHFSTKILHFCHHSLFIIKAYLWGPEADDDGEGEVRLQDVASSLNTTQSALTCGLDKVRVQRQYID